jgi:Replication-relaxation
LDSFAPTFAPPFQRESASGAVAPGSRPSVAPDNPVQTSRPYSVLPYPSQSVLRTVTLFRQATASQLRRLHYTGTFHGTRVRSRKHLARLTALNKLRRIWDVYEGVAEFIYLPPDSKARAANLHALDITELRVRFSEITGGNPGNNEVIFDPEPWRWYKVGPTGLHPDGYIDTGRRFFLEMDEGTEYRGALTDKVRQYIAAFGQWPDTRFPKVLFVCHDSDRQRFIERAVEQVIADQPIPKSDKELFKELFDVCLFNDAAEVTGVSRTKPLCYGPGLDTGRI